MSGGWVDRAAVAVILLAATAYLARRAARRVASAFDRRASGACGAECGCDGATRADS